jgi:phosphoglycerate dehydrogenase-like enzyme
MTAKRRVLVTDSEYRKAEASFASARGLECLRAPDAEADLASAIRDAHASFVVVGPRPYSGPLYEALPAGGVIARFGVGHDGIDKAKATAAGLLCTNTPGVLNQSVAEHTMLLVGAAARRLPAMSANMARQLWEPVMGEELQAKTLAIVGCGGIGRAVARMATLGYGMRVVGCCRPDAPPPAALEHFAEVTNDFRTAVHGADFVSLHLSATRDNLRWVNRERLACLDRRTWLINTARGSVVDETALFDALLERRLGGAALDVFTREPYVPIEGGGDLRALANVILTPHVGSNTAAANRRMAERALHNIVLAERRAFADMDLVNPEVLSSRAGSATLRGNHKGHKGKTT